MMRVLIPCFFFLASVQAQDPVVSAMVLDSISGVPVSEVRVRCGDHGEETQTDPSGIFRLEKHKPGGIFHFQAPGYFPVSKRVSDSLGQVYLLPEEATEPDWIYPELENAGEGYLGGDRDLYQRRVAFDLSQAFYRPRGMDGREQEVRLNGFLMNSRLDGRARWSQWGGLNDVSRWREQAYGLQPGSGVSQGLLGSTSIRTDPLYHRPGLRITSSYSDRSYRGRLMLTYNRSAIDRLLSYSLSGSVRRGEQGHMAGTPYRAAAAFLGANLRITPSSRARLTVLYTDQDRGRSAAVTREVKELLGSRYNPYWGWEGGKKRNSRMRRGRGPLLQLNYETRMHDWNLEAGLGWRAFHRADSRLVHVEAASPDPTYYRYLPSYYAQNPVLPNRYNALLARQALEDAPQIDWQALVRANRSLSQEGKAAYFLSEDVQQLNSASFFTRLGYQSGGTTLHWQLEYDRQKLHQFALISDLLGAQYHLDQNYFDGYAYDMENPIRKVSGDHHNYDYQLRSARLYTTLRLGQHFGPWYVSLGAGLGMDRAAREGAFRNGAYPESSLGPGPEKEWWNTRCQLHMQYAGNQRYRTRINLYYGNRPPVYNATWLDARQTYTWMPGRGNEKVAGGELGMEVRLTDFTGKLTVYHSRIAGRTEARSYYAETVWGDDFFRVVELDREQRHSGIEASLEYEWLSGLKGNLVWALGQATYANDPEVLLFRDQDAGSPIAGGKARLRGEALARGAPSAISLGLEYRDPKYWFIGLTFNQLQGARISPAILQRTDSFTADFDGAQSGSLAELPDRELPKVVLTNLVCGKSRKGSWWYASLFVSINNLFDVTYSSGGFEQGRKSTYQGWIDDNAGGSPRFGPKFWTGYGRTIFLNLALSI